MAEAVVVENNSNSWIVTDLDEEADPIPLTDLVSSSEYATGVIIEPNVLIIDNADNKAEVNDESATTNEPNALIIDNADNKADDVNGETAPKDVSVDIPTASVSDERQNSRCDWAWTFDMIFWLCIMALLLYFNLK